ncbi:hypothetical protein AN1V17_06910 [Vallitalea sediminicola]
MSYKVVIIDDKPVIRESLMKTIKWKQYDCIVIAQAENGFDGEDIIDKYEPDIVVTDIKMPGMDGLELAEYIRDKRLDMKVIIITGYQEFEYAQKAIRLGIVDLVLKPIDNNKFESIIDKTIQKITEERSRKELQIKILNEKNMYKNKVDSSLSTLRSSLISDIIQKRKAINEFTSKDICDLKLNNIKYHTIVSRVRSNNTNIVTRMSNKLRELVYEYISINHLQIIDTIINKDSVFIIIFDKSISARKSKIKIKNILREIYNIIMQEYEMEYYCVVVSPMSKKIEDLVDCYNDAVNVLNRNYFHTENNIMFSNDFKLMNIADDNTMINDLDSFYNVIKNMSESNINQEIDKIINKIVANANGNIFAIKCLISEICITLMRHYIVDIYEQSQVNKSVNKLINEIDFLSNVKQVKNYLKSYLLYIRKCTSMHKKINNPTVNSAISYISQNYKKDISLTEIAEYISINPSYLSRLLKKETGNNFVEILTDIRMSKAKQMLTEPGSKIIEVCKAVGYKDYSYFYQVFKKNEGVSPSQYIKLGKKI